jgi:predicted Rossmann fold nucleotide-binding protein DprA/Smf involved in DNA uptake
MKNKIYAGVGSRETPEAIQKLMFKIAAILARKGYKLRSGAAEGAAADRGPADAGARDRRGP